jgi:uncharacterized ion transporter superfamily protein YfcC
MSNRNYQTAISITYRILIIIALLIAVMTYVVLTVGVFKDILIPYIQRSLAG